MMTIASKVLAEVSASPDTRFVKPPRPRRLRGQPAGPGVRLPRAPTDGGRNPAEPAIDAFGQMIPDPGKRVVNVSSFPLRVFACGGPFMGWRWWQVPVAV